MVLDKNARLRMQFGGRGNTRLANRAESSTGLHLVGGRGLPISGNRTVIAIHLRETDIAVPTPEIRCGRVGSVNYCFKS